MSREAKIKTIAIAGGLAAIIFLVLRQADPPANDKSGANHGTFSGQTLGCYDKATQQRAQELLNKGDWLGGAAMSYAGSCRIFNVGDRWKVLERDSRTALVYATQDGVPHRVYVATSKLASDASRGSEPPPPPLEFRR